MSNILLGSYSAKPHLADNCLTLSSSWISQYTSGARCTNLLFVYYKYLKNLTNLSPAHTRSTFRGITHSSSRGNKAQQSNKTRTTARLGVNIRPVVITDMYSNIKHKYVAILLVFSTLHHSGWNIQIYHTLA